MHDLLIAGGLVIDGTGAAPRLADVAVDGDRISAVGDLVGATATATIDASGRRVAPGFIDLLGHSYYSLLVDPTARSKVAQGVTLEVTGERLGAGPVLGEARRLVQEEGLDALGLDLTWHDHTTYAERLARTGTAMNLACTTPGALLRGSVTDPWATSLGGDEMDRVLELLHDSFRQGSVGLTLVLEEPPCSYYSRDQLLALLEVVRQHDRLAMFHLRDEASGLVQSVAEVVDLLRCSGARGEILHLKALMPANWALLSQALEQLRRARGSGVDVTANVYPYTAAGLALQQLAPGLVELGPRRTRELLEDDDERARLESWFDSVAMGWDGIYLAEAGSGARAESRGRSFVELAHDRSISPSRLACDLLAIADDWVHLTVECMSMTGIAEVLREPWTGVVSDGSARDPDVAVLADGPVHPREYGTFPRLLRLALDDAVLTEHDAVHRVTGRAAQRLGLEDRGVVTPGAAADLVIYSAQEVRDRATVVDPNLLSEGVHHVIVNGVVVLSDRRRTRDLPGRVVTVRPSVSTIEVSS